MHDSGSDNNNNNNTNNNNNNNNDNYNDNKRFPAHDELGTCRTSHARTHDAASM